MKQLFRGDRARLRWFLAIAAVGALVIVATALAFNPDTLVSVGSPPSPFSQNK